jgi:LssY C-terminus
LAARASRTTGFSRSVARAIVGNDNCCRQDCFRGAAILAKAGRLGLKQPPGAEGGEIEAFNSLASSLSGSRAGDRRRLVLRITDRRLPTILALSLTYAIAAYMILPRVVRMGLKILQRKRVPSFTLTGDGLPGDPVNLAPIGEFERLRAAFARAGWIEADPLNLRSSWGMAVAFVLNRPYPAAPFSWLYLFGRKQDVGFQKAIDMSPRKRHHIRFWALSLERAEDTLNKAEFWLNIDRPPLDAPVLWIGAGTRDTGSR